MVTSHCKLAIGTAQFGMSYGISNKKGIVPVEVVGEIISRATQRGVDTIDTAISYGRSETVLGSHNLSQFKVISKLPRFDIDSVNAETWVKYQFLECTRRLNVRKLDALLLHEPEQLFQPNGKLIYRALLNLKRAGLIDGIGISIYSPEVLDLIIDEFEIDIVQAPFNIFDRRIVMSGWLSKLKQHNIRVFARSIFLQGLLLMDKFDRPSKFLQWSDLWDRWDAWLIETNQTNLEACLRYVYSYSDFHRFILGFHSLQQFEDVLAIDSYSSFDLPEKLFSEDLALIEPSRW